MNFEYKGFKYGISVCGGTYHFYTEKLMRLGKPQQELKAKKLEYVHREIKKMIDAKLKD